MTDFVCVHVVVLAAVVSTSVCFMLTLLLNRMIRENIFNCDGIEGVSISFILCFLMSVPTVSMHLYRGRIGIGTSYLFINLFFLCIEFFCNLICMRITRIRWILKHVN